MFQKPWLVMYWTVQKSRVISLTALYFQLKETDYLVILINIFSDFQKVFFQL